MGARLSRRASSGKKSQQPILHPEGLDLSVERNRVPTPEDSYAARVCVIGEAGIGKTSITERFTKNQFSAARPNDKADEYNNTRFDLSRQIRRGVELNANSIIVTVNMLNENLKLSGELTATVVVSYLFTV